MPRAAGLACALLQSSKTGEATHTSMPLTQRRQRTRIDGHAVYELTLSMASCRSSPLEAVIKSG